MRGLRILDLLRPGICGLWRTRGKPFLVLCFDAVQLRLEDSKLFSGLHLLRFFSLDRDDLWREAGFAVNCAVGAASAPGEESTLHAP